MRKYLDFNNLWNFNRMKEGDQWEAVTLPHTWNAKDGQDGGNDYHRGVCLYKKIFDRPEVSTDEEIWIEFEGVALSCEVSMNGKTIGAHKGGYSTFRIQLDELLDKDNELTLKVSNENNREIYPQKADFTFYGGIYRDVKLIILPRSHFSLDDDGSSGIRITTYLTNENNSAEVDIEVVCSNTEDGTPVRMSIEGVDEKESEIRNGSCKIRFSIESVRLWNGTKDPYLYIAKAELPSGDKISTHFGCRSFQIDPERGFFLNGRAYPLCGAARHQDRQRKGNALSASDHDEDMEIMKEMGCNTVRLAHYQHAQYFYDLCDKNGMIVWAEIPYITEHMDEGLENTVLQMTELVKQNINHPSIICWGLSNEITASGGVQSRTVENHIILNDLCHKLDPTRKTVMAHAFMLDIHDQFVRTADLSSYNLYYGWYLGEKEENADWFDEYHRAFPEEPIGLSEFGADANPSYQSPSPEKGDWSESYQAIYHEYMLKMWSERPYIWAMHVWNLFDFGADGRNEGGKPGQNQKGLVTFDRKIRKDAFYIYKAYLSSEKFIHLCGKRYKKRYESVTEIKVYTNLHEVTVFMDGKEIAKKATDKVMSIQIPISGKHLVEVRSGDFKDSMLIERVEQKVSEYLKDGGSVTNWFDKEEEMLRTGYYSIMDTLEDLKKNQDASLLIKEIMSLSKAAYGDVAKNVILPEKIQKQMDKTSFIKLLKQMSKIISQDKLREINSKLNKIPRNSN